MIQPTREQLAALSRTERVTFRVAELMMRLPGRAFAWNDAFMSGLVGACGNRRLEVRGLEHLAQLGKRDSIVFVSNHRSFFDFYILIAVIFWNTRLSRRIRFPVRANFFYDHPLGPVVNMAMSGMRMFPPILREREKSAFNRFALERCVEELRVPGTIMGLHPEGTRNKGPDPYALLPAQPGVGKVVIEANDAHVIPAFVLGLSNSLHKELVHNVFAPSEHVIDVWFGPEIDLGDLRAQKSRASNHLRAANRCRDAIARLAVEHRRVRGGVHGETAVAAQAP
jgi:1-acyl-sn-glycerol-3-phosphate acyltransferase